MNAVSLKRNKKKILNFVLFFGITLLTLYAVFHGQDLGQLWNAVRRLTAPYLLTALAAALFYVSAEGGMIWYLLRSLSGKSGLLRCIGYSFIGFFYSGITPSATGGQPMQLYYMKKDGNSLSESSVVLMTVAVIYKFVLVVIGGAMLIGWYHPLQIHLQGYFGLYLLGLWLNVLLVAALIAVMAAPKAVRSMLTAAERLMIRLGIWKKSADREEKFDQFVCGYQNSVHFLSAHKNKIAVVILFTFLQRGSLFLLTFLIYRGFSLSGTGMMTVTLLQASVYIAVDMLPLPGAQGITELMYQGVFAGVFTGGYLMPSLCVTRGINFYFLLIVSLAVVIANQVMRKKAAQRAPEAG